MTMQSRQLTNQDRDFYKLLGPFLARRDVHRIIGAPPWDDEGKQWFVVLRDGKVAGFAAVTLDNDTAIFCSDYAATGDVVVRERLMRERLKWAKSRAQSATSTVSRHDREVYERNGFRVVKESQNFATMTREMKWQSA